MQIIDYNSKDLVWILTKIGTNDNPWIPYKCIKFQPDRNMGLWVIAIFKCAKRQRREEKSTCIVGEADMIFFKCLMLSPLADGHFHSEFSIDQTNDHRAVNASNLNIVLSVDILM